MSEEDKRFISTHERLGRAIERMVLIEDKFLELANRMTYIEGDIEILKGKFKTHANTYHAHDSDVREIF